MRRIRKWFSSLMQLNGSPGGISGGFALGVALSLIPVPFLGMVLALALAPVVRANLPATYAGTAVVNPFTAAFFYFGELVLGLWLLGEPIPAWADLRGLDAAGWWEMFKTMLWPFMLGAAVAIPTFGVLSYLLVYLTVRRWRGKNPDDGSGPAHA